MNKPKLRFLLLTAVMVAVVGLTAFLVGRSPDAVTAQSAPDVPAAEAAPVHQPKDVTGSEFYIVQLQAPSLASYSGGAAGLEATMPAARGEISLDPNSPASIAYLDYLEQQQAAALDNVAGLLGRALNVRHQYLYVLNAFAVELTPEEAETVASLPEVKQMWRNFYHTVETDTGPSFIGADTIWDGSATGGLPGTQGEGLVAAIIDTGINLDHPSFADIGGDGYDHENPLGAGNYVGWCDENHPDYDDTLECNDKLIGVYSYPAADDQPEDDSGHGSHTASTVAGNVVSATIPAGTFQVSGVAPHANIIALDVCFPNGATFSCAGTAILAAINDVVANANIVSVINYSIGGGSSDPWASADALAYLDALNAGVLPVTSAGNSGPGAATIGSPADAPWMMAVGASTHGRVFDFELGISGPEPVSPTLQTLEALAGNGATVTQTIDVEIEYSGLVEPANIEGCDPYASQVFDGKIALISRGSCSFEIKLDNAQAAGAIAGIIHNNVAGDGPINMNVGAATLPAYSISLEDGDAVVSWIQANSDATARITPSIPIIIPADADNMAGFSSRGPNPATDVLKPDVAAPGVSILAAVNTVNPGDPPEFALFNGTSMASPHTAGAALLMRALYPTWTPQEVRSAIMLTGVTDLVKEDGTTPADPFDFGNGRVDLTQAGTAGLVMDATFADYTAANPALGGIPSELNLPTMATSACAGVCSWTRTVRNPSPILTSTWDLTLSTPMSVTGTVEPSTFTVGPGETATITVTLDVSVLPLDAEYQFARVDLMPDLGPTIPVGPPPMHMNIAAQPAGIGLPDTVEIFTDNMTGTTTLQNVFAITTTDTTVELSGLTPGTQVPIQLAEDATNGTPYDDLSQVYFALVTVPADTERLVAEIVASESPDVDLFWGLDTNGNDLPDAGEQLDLSASGTAFEYLSVNNPPAGDYWVLVQNWEGSGAATDFIQLSYAVVESDNSNLTVDLPAQISLGTPFDIDFNHDIDGPGQGGGYWYGYFTVGTDAGNPGNMGAANVDFHYEFSEMIYLPAIFR